MNKELIVGNLSAKAGEKTQGYLKVEGTTEEMPVTIINGKREGKTLLVTAGVHGCEYTAIKAVMELSRELDPEEVHGQVILVHPVNLKGFKKKTAALMPEDGKNILRVFPGNNEGSVSEKIAYTITTELISKADFYLDVHGGDLHEDLLPHIYYPGSSEKHITEASIKIAEVFDVPYYVKSMTTNGTYTTAALGGVPSLLVERGGAGIIKAEDVILYKRDILNVMAKLNMIEYTSGKRKFKPVEIKNARYEDSRYEGCWICYVKPGDYISKGQKLGDITDFFGNVIYSCTAEFDGVILYNTVAFSVAEGDSLVAYGEV